MSIYLVLLAGVIAAANEFSYKGDTGPEYWPDLFPTCKGRRQSPINLRTQDFSIFQRDLLFTSYDVHPANMSIMNNGHSVQTSMTFKRIPLVSGGGMRSAYKLEQYHFHWGPDDYSGSEHTINGVRYPLEMHLVHFNARYGSFIDAVHDATVRRPTLLVIAVLFEISQTDNAAFSPIIRALDNIKEEGSETRVEPAYPIRALLPEDVYHFFRYEGSLTTPTCNEIVHWLVFKTPVHISSSQLEKFRKLQDKDGRPLNHNFRPIQDLNGRRVRMIKTRLNCVDKTESLSNDTFF